MPAGGSASGADLSESYRSALRTLLRRVPLHLSAVHVSLLNRLRGEPLPRLSDLLYTYRPYAFNPLRLLPPFEKHAQLVDGRHAFTFAGAQLSIDAPAAACNYVLATDAVNGNFTLVAKLDASGQRLLAIVLIDRTGTVELLADGAVRLNGASSELPAVHGELVAYRRWHTLAAWSAAGVHVECTLDLRVCSITVDGFYHGQLRGVLGTASTEPLLDGRLPDGSAAATPSALVNGWSTGGKQCSADAHAHGPETTTTSVAHAGE